MEKVYVVKANSYTVINYGVYTEREQAEEQAANFAPTSCEVEEQLRITRETRKLLEQARLHAMSVVGQIDDALKCEGAEAAIDAADWWGDEVDNIDLKLGEVMELSRQQLEQARFEENEGVII